MNGGLLSQDFVPWMQMLAVGALLAGALIHIVFALGVWYSAEWVIDRKKRKTEIVHPGFWCLATLVGGVFVAWLFWLVHFSTLNPYVAIEVAAAGKTGPGDKSGPADDASDA